MQMATRIAAARSDRSRSSSSRNVNSMKRRHQRLLLKSLPANAVTLADYYKQDVYDRSDERISQTADLILEKLMWCPPHDLLGIRTKYVAVPFAALQMERMEE
jgi:hypothetical protein